MLKKSQFDFLRWMNKTNPGSDEDTRAKKTATSVDDCSVCLEEHNYPQAAWPEGASMTCAKFQIFFTPSTS